MENILAKIESLFVKKCEELEKNPIKVGLQVLLLIFIIKKIIKWVKD